MARHAKISLTGFVGAVAAAAVGVVVGGCATREPPTGVDHSDVRARMKTVAFAPFRSLTAIVRREQVQVAFEGRATERLIRAGVKVVAPAVWDELWRRYADDVGGVYDASTGEADEEKYAAVRNAVYRELVETHDVDGILYLEVRVVEHYGVRQSPQVCGQVIVPYWPGGWGTNPGRNATSLVRSTCLVGVLVDPTQKQYFARQAGLEGIETYDFQTRAIRPPDLVFMDEGVLDFATDIVLEPFGVVESSVSGESTESGESAELVEPTELGQPNADAETTAPPE